MSTGRWSATDAELLWKTWGEESVVYNCRSGDTHLLDALGAAILVRLQESPAAIDGLRVDIAAKLAVSDDAAFQALIEGLIGEFDRLGLVHRVP